MGKTNYRINQEIKDDKVKVIFDSGDQKILQTYIAINIANKEGLDLVEVGKNGEFPICKILDYRKFIYDREKKEKENKKKQVKIETKEIRFTPNTGKHDLEFKKQHIIAFLKGGNKVKISVFFKGREKEKPERGELILYQLMQELIEVSKVEKLPKLEGNYLSTTLTPKTNGKI